MEFEIVTVLLNDDKIMKFNSVQEGTELIYRSVEEWERDIGESFEFKKKQLAVKP